MEKEIKQKDWEKQAYCAQYPDPDLWHYQSSILADEKQLAEWRTAEAIRMCRACPVQDECLAEGLKDENLFVYDATEGTIWGGKLQGERLNIKHGKITFKYKKETSFLREVKKKIAILDQ